MIMSTLIIALKFACFSLVAGDSACSNPLSSAIFGAFSVSSHCSSALLCYSECLSLEIHQHSDPHL